MSKRAIDFVFRIAASVWLAVSSQAAWADDPLDRHIAFDESGQRRFDYRLAKSLLAAYDDTIPRASGAARLGQTFRQSGEAYLLTRNAYDMTLQANRYQTPGEAYDRERWREKERSLPRDRASGVAAAVTPFVMEYMNDHPIAWTLAVLPAYQIASRAKLSSPWQTDVLTGAILGAASGYLSHERAPLVVRPSSKGVFIGIHRRF